VKLTLDLQRESADPALPAAPMVRRWVRAALAGRRERAELTVRLVDEPEMIELNQTYRHKTGSTNVLSFPFEAPPGITLALLGDVVICAPVVAREAAEQGKLLNAHWCHMVVHGVLHLLGFDHQTDNEAHTMERLETEIITALGFADPYAEVNSTDERRHIRL